MTRNRLGDLGSTLGDHLREQRQAAKLSLRQLSELAGVSNPYLSQIERGLKRPSAEILQQLAKALEVSAESLYVRAGILEDREPAPGLVADVRHAVSVDPRLTERQKATLLDVYESFVGGVAVAGNGHGTAASAAAVVEAITGGPTTAERAGSPSTPTRSPKAGTTSAAKGTAKGTTKGTTSTAKRSTTSGAAGTSPRRASTTPSTRRTSSTTGTATSAPTPDHR
jgi:transcriptional regulator with XRE-family HTH domain